MKKVIAITGLNGVLGKKLLESLPSSFKKEYEFIDLYHSKRISISDPNISISHQKIDLNEKLTIIKILAKINPSVIIHLAAVTHIDKCEKDKKNGKNGLVWQINVTATKKIVEFCKKNNVHLIYLSTECVFDGKSKKSYLEKSKTNPINWYGNTKAHAEQIIMESNIAWTIIRSVIAYDLDESVPSIFSSINNSFKKNTHFSVVSDQKFTPTFIPDIYKSIWRVIKNNQLGIFHITPPNSITPYQFAIAIGKHFGYDLSLVRKQRMIEYMGVDSAKLRLKNASLDSKASAQSLKFKPKNILDALKNT